VTDTPKVDRHAKDYVTVAHVSDLHIGIPGEEDRTTFNTYFSQFGAELKAQKVDLVCVTGDIADNPIKDWLAFGRDTLLDAKSAARLAHWIDGLDKTFARARDHFSEWAKTSGLDLSERFFAVPGNHDLRPQGISASVKLGKR
jgi:3',5'-cyclic AMP phosphodiesterase CpdA